MDDKSGAEGTDDLGYMSHHALPTQSLISMYAVVRRRTQWWP